MGGLKLQCNSSRLKCAAATVVVSVFNMFERQVQLRRCDAANATTIIQHNTICKKRKQIKST